MTKDKGKASGQKRMLLEKAESIRTHEEFAAFQSTLIGDVLQGKVSPADADAASRVCKKWLKDQKEKMTRSLIKE